MITQKMPAEANILVSSEPQRKDTELQSSNQIIDDVFFKRLPPEAEKEKRTVNSYRIRSNDAVFDRPLLKQGDVTLMSKGNTSIIKGKPKAGKSTLICVLAAAYLGCDTFGLTTCKSGGKVLVIDTEQNDADCILFLKKAEKLAGLDGKSDSIVSLLVNEMQPMDIRTFVEDAIIEYAPDLLFIDGLLDLALNFNDVEDASVLVTFIRQLAIKYDNHICCALHEGKGSGELLGHLGATALRKAQAVYQLVKTGDSISVSPNAMRRKPFVEFSLMFDEKGMPIYGGELIQTTNEATRKINPAAVSSNIHEEVLQKVFELQSVQKRGELLANIPECFRSITGRGFGESLAKRFLTFYEHNDYLKIDSSKSFKSYECGKLVRNSVMGR